MKNNRNSYQPFNECVDKVYDIDKENLISSNLPDFVIANMVKSPLLDFNFNLKSPYMIYFGDFVHLERKNINHYNSDYISQVLPYTDFGDIEDIFNKYEDLQNIYIPLTTFHIVGFNDVDSMEHFIHANNMNEFNYNIEKAKYYDEFLKGVDPTDEMLNEICPDNPNFNKTISYFIIKNHHEVHYDLRVNMILDPLAYVNILDDDENYDTAYEITEIKDNFKLVHNIDMNYKASEDVDETIMLENYDCGDTMESFSNKINKLIRNAKCGKLLTDRSSNYNKLKRYLKLVTKEEIENDIMEYSTFH